MPPTGHVYILADSLMPEKLVVGAHVSVLSAMCMCACCGTAERMSRDDTPCMPFGLGS